MAVTCTLVLSMFVVVMVTRLTAYMGRLAAELLLVGILSGALFSLLTARMVSVRALLLVEF